MVLTDGPRESKLDQIPWTKLGAWSDRAERKRCPRWRNPRRRSARPPHYAVDRGCAGSPRTRRIRRASFGDGAPPPPPPRIGRPRFGGCGKVGRYRRRGNYLTLLAGGGHGEAFEAERTSRSVPASVESLGKWGSSSVILFNVTRKLKVM